jgi:hypothetical protein
MKAGQWVLWCAFLLSAGCSADHKTSTGRTQRESDSVIGQSSIPGASGVTKAMESQDSARARAAAIDSLAATE